MNAPLYSSDILLERLTAGVRRNDRSVSFLIGSALSVPQALGAPGVPGVLGIIDLIRAEFQGAQLAEFEAQIAGSENQYQEAFHFLHGRRGPEVANAIIKQAVWKARKPAIGDQPEYVPGVATADETCQSLDDDLPGWHLSPSHAALGRLITCQQSFFGKSILTTNFDPLIEVAIRSAGGNSFRTVLHRDGDLGQTQGMGCHVVHLHGYWHGSDTLHSPRQLLQSRPRLKASLSHLIAGRTLVVLGYGGWDDVFSQALMDVVLDDRLSPDILWTFLGSTPTLRSTLAERLAPGLDRGRVTFYVNTDSHIFLPKLAEAWNASAQFSQALSVPNPSFTRNSTESITKAPRRRIVFSRAQQDHPPKLEYYVGRLNELAQLKASDASVLYITGIGGAGKSALAAHYLQSVQMEGAFDYYVWRDCKEESERFERQLISIVGALSDDKVGEHELAAQPIESITEVFLNLIMDTRLLIIFDNIDHYVDLERRILAGPIARFCERFLKRQSSCKIMFTCRPAIEHLHPSVLSFRLEGITAENAISLFELRNAPADATSIREAHRLTQGHAFWLDLLAAQLARRAPQIELADLLEPSDRDTPELPTATLRSIWATLKERERLVLHSLAETVKPTPILRLADYLASRLKYNQLHKAVKSLRGLSLLVVKPMDDGQELIELHPLVRAFIRANFPQLERDWFIHSILNVYRALFGLHRAELTKRPPSATIDYWSEGAELHIAAGEYSDACACLYEISDIVREMGSPTEFVRVCRLLFQGSDWKMLAKSSQFDDVMSAYVELQALAGKIEDCTAALEGYESTLQGKDARYINYCDLRCYMHWVNLDYLTAVKWGVEGVTLKESTGVDTKFDAAHNLALARRDVGTIDPALEYFLRKRKLAEVIAEKQPQASFGGAYYGNIGRCLHLMGQVDPALSCYRKSALLLAESDRAMVENQGYIRQWVGEVLISKGEFSLGFAFLEAAKEKWSLLSPPKAQKVARMINDVVGDKTYVPEPIISAEASWRRWISE